MTGNIYDWSIIPGNNDDADGDINWLEGQLPSTVNGSARQMMGRVAEWLKDNGVLVAPAVAGTANAIIITANSKFTTPLTGMSISFRAVSTNTATAVTVAVNGGASTDIRKMGLTTDTPLALGDIVAGGIYKIVYSSALKAGAGAWLLYGPSTSALPAGATVGGVSADAFPVGTRMLFQQTSAPTGWVKDVAATTDNRALRITTGTVGVGGTVAFSTAFSDRTTASSATGISVNGTAITIAQMPLHNHGGSTGFAGAFIQVISNILRDPFGIFSLPANGHVGFDSPSINIPNHAHSIPSEGGGQAHAHGITDPTHGHGLDMKVMYTDVIIAQKV